MVKQQLSSGVFGAGSICLVGALAMAMAHSAGAQDFSRADEARVDYDRATIEPSGDCAALESFEVDELVELHVEIVPAQGNVPTHCRVGGTLAPEIAFEVDLPALWNGRFYMIGNGGHAGQAPDTPQSRAQRAAALERGFAVAATDTGHDSREEPGATFVLSNPQKAIDYAYRAVHLTAVTAKALANEHYRRPVDYSYWNSCSNGGRQGLIEAQRYPEDFDGIIANAPWVDQTGFMLGAIWNQKALTDTPLSSEKLPLLADRVMAVCDDVDGLADGLIDDPRQCDFDPGRDVPSCPAGTNDASCLTTGEAATIARIYGGVVANGAPLFPGFMPGSEAINGGRSGWTGLIVPAQPGGRAADFGLAEGTLQYLVSAPPRPDYDVLSFDFDGDLSVIDRWAALANADDPDLSAFRRGGGKLLMTYGWADAILQPLMGVEYYEHALAVNGPDTPDFFRLFMIPGMAHCSGGIGPDQRDAVTAIIDWVEADTPPESILASKIVDGDVVRTRPLCPYPEVARYDGSGSIDDAGNFECTAP